VIPVKRLILILAILLTACQQAPITEGNTPTPRAPSTPEAKQLVLAAVGDSLTEGLGVDTEKAYPAQLEARLMRAGLDWKVINSGVSGETSSGALTRLDWVLKTKPDAVLLVTGANDGLRGLDPDLTQQNLDTIVTKLKQKDIKVMLGGMKAPANLGSDYTERFENIYPAVAEKHDVPLIPFFLDGVAKQTELNLEDGKHPNADGYKVIVDNIFEPVKIWLNDSAEG
jgi:acyl-CoA thioesterase-1